ncbi:threonine synthase [Acidiphilium sp. AL]|uniref:Threonine synthase n=1 Tax=Acidiphilium iwatense TaxID=768198 RepID=A0ABS9DTQ9_9PROT|nr:MULTISPECIES: threonine synthase [Acidiphilium]MCF3946072.1 threonine synthase [Acidiphilium iwatense]MCU4161732.1 threonine synthase [Acidiphilium sp. AL]
MRYVSTRGGAPARDFDGVLLAGLAEDGGLFVPEVWPEFSAAEWRALRGLPYAELAARVMAPFMCGGAVTFADLQRICRDAYRGFDHAAVVPLVQLDAGLFALELFHGPTLAFKDLALQVAGRLFDHVLEARDERVTIVGATSGDTGSAAIEACRDRSRVDIAILHPEGKTSEVQRRQMTTVRAPNVLNIAVDGNFDDCQALVKAMFADAPFREELRLSAVNSINWARIAGQIPYFVAAALALGTPDREVAVAVPTGNFGNVLAAWAARRMGLPVAKFVVASNANDILARFLAANDMSTTGVVETVSPSMDIQVSSNFERLLFEVLGRDAQATERTMADFRATGRMAVPDQVWRALKRDFAGFSLDDEATLAEIARIQRDTGYIADPHTAIGIAAARECAPVGVPAIAAATAHPAKFPEAMHRAIGMRPGLPERLGDLYHRPEVFQRSGSHLAEVQAVVRNFAHRNNA